MRPHEAWAAKLFIALLTTRGHVVEGWAQGADPPDLLFLVDGQRWAVEVTRADQRVHSATGHRSRTDTDAKLMAFGKSIAAKLRPSLRRPYLLTLRPMPGVTDTKVWRNKARKAIATAIASGNEGPFLIDAAGNTGFKGFEVGDRAGAAELRGYEVGEEGTINDIFIALDAPRALTPEGNAPYDILANLEEALRYALNDKSNKLWRIEGFDRIVLVLDNKYWLADIGDAKAVGGQLMPHFPIFDALYMIHAGALHEIYSRAPRPLPISIEQN
jgi:hypothetical protein